MKHTVPLELSEILYGADDQRADLSAVEDESTGGSRVPDGLEKFFKDAEFAAAAGGVEHVENLEAQTASVNTRAEQIYKTIADDAEKKVTADPQSLAKRDSGKVARVETTKYASGREVIAEIDEDGAVIRVYTKEAA
jgi:hypothetical protein